MLEFFRAVPPDEPALLADGWVQVHAWKRTCGGILWAWFRREAR